MAIPGRDLNAATEAGAPEPRTIVLDTVKEPGLSTFALAEGEQPRYALHLAIPLIEALRRPWPHKAYAVPYEIIGEEQWPRLNASALGEIRQRGREVLCGWMAVDLDFRPWGEGTEKQPWERFPEALERHLRLLEHSALLQDLTPPTAFYTTRNGFRAIYVLSRYVSPEEYETGARNLVRYWQRVIDETGASLVVDEKCLHWNCLFALPHVHDSGVTFSDQFWFRYAERLDARLDPARFVNVDHAEPVAGPVGQVAPGGTSGATRGISLDTLLADGFLAEDFKPAKDPGFLRQTILSMLKVDLFGEEPIAHHGARDDTLTQVAGAVAHVIRSMGGTVEEAAACMVWPGAVLNEQQSDTDQDPKDWIQVGIEKVCRFWARDYQPSKTGSVAAQIKREREVERTAIVLENEPHIVAMARVVHAQIGDPDLIDADPEVVRRALKRALVFARQRPDGSVPDQHFYLLPSGLYSQVSLKNPTADARFVALLKMLGEEPTSFAQMPPEQRAMGFGNVISQPDQLLFWPGEDDLDPTTVRLARTSSGLAVQSYRLKRTPAEPKRSELVDGWLRAMAGEQFHKLEQWIAAALAVEEGPVPALFLFGESDAGKSLFIEQICRAFSGPGGQCSPTAGATLLGGFEDALETCPVVAFDEAGGSSWSKGESSLMFRRLAGCRQFVAKRKFKAPANCRIAYRVICAANNPNAIKAMLAGETRADTDAVVRRLLVIGVNSEKSKEYLRNNRIPQREFLEHFRWLYSRRRELGVEDGEGGYMLVPPDLGPIDRDEAIAEAVIDDPKTGSDLDMVAQYICEKQDLVLWVDADMGGWLLVSPTEVANWARIHCGDPSVSAKRISLQIRRLVQGAPARMFRGGEQRRVICMSPDKVGLLLRETHCNVARFIERAKAAGYIALDRVLKIVGT